MYWVAEGMNLPMQQSQLTTAVRLKTENILNPFPY